jgi:chemotaxis methyl-accepting protein methylase
LRAGALFCVHDTGRNKTGFHRILATDIDESALTQAKNGGPYTTIDVRNIEKSLLEKYFTQDKSGFGLKTSEEKTLFLNGTTF